MDILRFGTTRRYSDVVTYQGLAYLVEVPSNPHEDITAQTLNMLTSVERQLTEVGSGKSRILSATLYLSDMANYNAMNLVWDQWIPEACAPVRACIQARLANPELRVEIALTAALG